jgi:hypothetical protein
MYRVITFLASSKTRSNFRGRQSKGRQQKFSLSVIIVFTRKCGPPYKMAALLVASLMFPVVPSTAPVRILSPNLIYFPICYVLSSLQYQFQIHFVVAIQLKTDRHRSSNLFCLRGKNSLILICRHWPIEFQPVSGLAPPLTNTLSGWLPWCSGATVNTWCYRQMQILRISLHPERPWTTSECWNCSLI